MLEYTTLDDFVADLPRLSAQARETLRGHDGLFLLETAQGRRLYIRLRDGLATVADQENEAAVCRVVADEGVLLDMIHGMINPAKALLLRKVMVHGDMRPLLRLIACIK